MSAWRWQTCANCDSSGWSRWSFPDPLIRIFLCPTCRVGVFGRKGL